MVNGVYQHFLDKIDRVCEVAKNIPRAPIIKRAVVREVSEIIEVIDVEQVRDILYHALMVLDDDSLGYDDIVSSVEFYLSKAKSCILEADMRGDIIMSIKGNDSIVNIYKRKGGGVLFTRHAGGADSSFYLLTGEMDKINEYFIKAQQNQPPQFYIGNNESITIN